MQFPPGLGTKLSGSDYGTSCAQYSAPASSPAPAPDDQEWFRRRDYSPNTSDYDSDDAPMIRNAQVPKSPPKTWSHGAMSADGRLQTLPLLNLGTLIEEATSGWQHPRRAIRPSATASATTELELSETFRQIQVSAAHAPKSPDGVPPLTELSSD